METKICTKCGKEKEINDFSIRSDNKKYKNECKECTKTFQKQYRKINKERIRKCQKKYLLTHKEQRKETVKKYYYKNAGKLKKLNQEYRETHKEAKKQYAKKYYETHKKDYQKRKKEKLQTDYAFLAKERVRKVIRYSFVRKGFRKNSKTEKILGCDFQTFYNHLLKTFYNNYGYEWDKKEKVHIDHIKPLKKCKTEEEVIKLCHYTNLQLLKAHDNLEKSDKLNWKIKKED